MRTPLYDVHASAGATFTEFAGYEMPVHYGSIKQEHHQVRNSVGLFDVSHMSNLTLALSDADALSCICPFDAAGLEVGRGKYTVVLREDGTILDDCFVFRLEDHFHVIPNAGQNHAVASSLKAAGAVKVSDETAQWAILALQGPDARTVLAEVSRDQAPGFHRINAMDIAGTSCLVSGTGYTGEKGVEVYCPSSNAPAVWEALMREPVQPIGLGARDTLRLEKGYCLAGNEFAGGRTPLEAGLGWLINWDVDFQAKEALLAQKEAGHDRLLGLTQEKGVPRQGHVVQVDDEEAGIVTSGTMSPSLGRGIALAYVSRGEPGDAVEVVARGRTQEATLTKPPFVV